MIVKMKKVTVITPAGNKEECVLALRRAGVLHVEHVVQPVSEGLDAVDRKISDYKQALDILRLYEHTKESEKIGRDEVSADSCVKSILAQYKEKENTEREAGDIKTKLDWYENWGAFDPAEINALAARGIKLRLYTAPAPEIKKISALEGAHIVKNDGRNIFFTHVAYNNTIDVPYDEVRMPEEAFETLYRKYESDKSRIEEINSNLRCESFAMDSLKKHIAELENKRKFLAVVSGMKEDEGISYVRGYCPADKVSAVTALAKKEGYGYMSEDPADDDEAPTLIRNPRWLEIIKPVFSFMNTVPGYKEFDISFVFLLFFSLFFAMIIGDAGYGVLFLAATIFAKRKLKNAPAQPFILMGVLSVATILWGSVTGTWFGVEQIAKMPFFSSLIISKLNSFSDANQNFIIYLCFVIGVIHLTIAHIILGMRVINSIKVISEIGWILILWGIFFTAGTLVLNNPFPPFAGYLLGSGALMVLFFANPGNNILKGAMSTAIDLPLKIISSFSDVVSYLRLFAVGYASMVVAASFNEMAVGSGINNIVAGFMAALILVFGHLLNIILGFMAVIVHGIRLNMLEFSGHLGMEWSGKEYAPLKEEI